MRLRARASSPLSGLARPPGDKSISHRAVIFGALARGETTIAGLLEADDVARTIASVRAFGAAVEQVSEGRWRVNGQGALRQPTSPIDCGNSGTGVRLLMGAAAGFPISARFDGDSSLRKRPMNRIIAPLTQMGARFDDKAGRLPITLHGGALKGMTYRSPVASAQIKSAVLIAGLQAEGETVLIEPAPSRDHTERMMATFGAAIDYVEIDAVRAPRVRRSAMTGAHVDVPADPSSAAFPIAAGLICAGSTITLEGVLTNPLRTGFLATVREMGARIEVAAERNLGAETTADIVVRASKLTAASPPESRAPAMIDEYPILAILAAFAEGETRLTGVKELRVKESDRIALTAEGLRACGVPVEELPDGLVVRGVGAKGVRGGAAIRTGGDHRIAMSFLILGLASKEPVTVDDADMIATSFPGFAELMRSLGADIGAV